MDQKRLGAEKRLESELLEKPALPVSERFG
jgi:hypothetical protein